MYWEHMSWRYVLRKNNPNMTLICLEDMSWELYVLRICRDGQWYMSWQIYVLNICRDHQYIWIETNPNMSWGIMISVVSNMYWRYVLKVSVVSNMYWGYVLNDDNMCLINICIDDMSWRSVSWVICIEDMSWTMIICVWSIYVLRICLEHS